MNRVSEQPPLDDLAARVEWMLAPEKEKHGATSIRQLEEQRLWLLYDVVEEYGDAEALREFFGSREGAEDQAVEEQVRQAKKAHALMSRHIEERVADEREPGRKRRVAEPQTEAAKNLRGLRNKIVSLQPSTEALVRYAESRAAELGFTPRQVMRPMQGNHRASYQPLKDARAQIIAELAHMGASIRRIGSLFGMKQPAVVALRNRGRILLAIDAVCGFIRAFGTPSVPSPDAPGK